MNASLNDRLWARLIDSIFLFLIELPFWWVIFSLFWIDEDYVQVPWGLFAYFVVAHLSTQILFYYILGATPGKWLMGLRLTGANRAPLSLGQASLRVLTSELSFYFSWALYASAFFSVHRRHWVDIWCETQVVPIRAQAQEIPKQRNVLAAALMLFYVALGLTHATSILSAIEWDSESKSFLVSSDVTGNVVFSGEDDTD